MRKKRANGTGPDPPVKTSKHSGAESMLDTLRDTPLVVPFDGDEEDQFDHSAASAYSFYSGIMPLKAVMAERSRAETDTDPPQEGTQLPPSRPHTDRLYRIPPDRLFPEPQDQRMPPRAQLVHNKLRAQVLSEEFPCLGASAAFHHGSYRVGYYRDLGHPAAALVNAYDLRRFVTEYRQLGNFSSFVAIFERPDNITEEKFEKLLWKHLQELHKLDGHDWDIHYVPDPEDPHFAFSFGGCAFFVVGLNASASREARRMDHPILAFNPESQIHDLKRQGLFSRFAREIRRRDNLLQGSNNVSTPEDPESRESEARAYSGVPHPPGSEWKCPFKPRADVVAEHKDKHVPPDLTPQPRHHHPEPE